MKRTDILEMPNFEYTAKGFNELKTVLKRGIIYVDDMVIIDVYNSCTRVSSMGVLE